MILSNILGKLIYNEIDWFFLLLLHKVEKGKDELRDSNSQLKHYISSLKVSICSLKEIFKSSPSGLILLKNHRIVSVKCFEVNTQLQWVISSGRTVKTAKIFNFFKKCGLRQRSCHKNYEVERFNFD